MSRQQPYDERGRFVPLQCALCGCGMHRHQGHGEWACDGLLDPGDSDKDLEACPNRHVDGHAAVSWNEQPHQGAEERAS